MCTDEKSKAQSRIRELQSTPCSCSVLYQLDKDGGVVVDSHVCSRCREIQGLRAIAFPLFDLLSSTEER